MGIDLVVQSATKYIGGHSDTVAGVITGSQSRLEKMFSRDYMLVGSGIQPFNAWLLMRGLRTLPLRLQRISVSTRKVIDYLKTHPLVKDIVFPFNEDFPQYELAKEQMGDSFGLFNFSTTHSSLQQVEHFCNRLKVFKMAVSWGGHESLIMPFCAFNPAEEFDHSNSDHTRFRLYVGLEEPEFLINDLKQALG